MVFGRRSFILYYFCAFFYFIKVESVTIRTDNGYLEGKESITVGKQRSYYQFLGIPFAQPPVGNLRFEPPRPIPNWKGTLSAVTDPSPCVQTNGSIVVGSEDCLYISVYTPKLPNITEKNLPVMVWIYGGGFEAGLTSYFDAGPDYFMDEDVVVVSLNYRVGIFGFLSLQDLVVPGNNGLKDQVLALKWINNNVVYFGGNPKNITIFGQSAGSASVSYLLQSPLTKGLFHQAIMESGTSLCLWTLATHSVEMAQTLGKDLKLDTSSSQALVSGLRTINATYLQQKMKAAIGFKYLTVNPLDGFLIGPVIEPDHPGAILSKESYELMQNGSFHHVPCIIGYNSLEGTFSAGGIFRLFLTQYDLNPGKIVPGDLDIKNATTKTNVGKQIKSYYFGFLPIVVGGSRLEEFISDNEFVRPIQKFAKLASKFTTVYLYEFTYEGGLGGIENRTSPGVAHSEELGYLFRRYKPANYTDALTRQRMIKMWTNFAKFGQPTPSKDPLLQSTIWDPLNYLGDETVLYMNIGYNLKVGINPQDKDMQFWESIYNTHGTRPFSTY